MIFSQNDQELYKFVGFHCQQSVEMSMKAFLTFVKFKYDKTHDLEKLGKKILELHPEIEPLLIDAKDLTPYAVQIRYEEFFMKPITEQMTKNALQIATGQVVSCDAGKSLSEALMRQPGQIYAYPLQGCYCPCPIFNWNAFFEESLNW